MNKCLVQSDFSFSFFLNKFRFFVVQVNSAGTTGPISPFDFPATTVRLNRLTL